MAGGRAAAESLPWRPTEEYEVVHEKVAVRKKPATSSQALAVVKRGHVVGGLRHEVLGEPWLCLSSTSRKELMIAEDAAWVLVHGRSVGLGELLRARPREQEAVDSKAAAAKSFEANRTSSASSSARPAVESDTCQGLRLGEGVWHHASVVPARDLGGESAPWANSAKRTGFRATSLGPVASAPRSPPVLLLMGGQVGPLYRNDVWRSDDEGRRWQLISPQEDGRRDESGSVLTTKWAGREGFACASGWSTSKGSKQSVVYVSCGVGARSTFADVWASEDLGRTWTRTCASAPFGRRKNPGLAVCPDSPLKLVLCGGMPWSGDSFTAAGVVVADCWLSDDAGWSWTQLNFPSAVPPRAGPMLAFTTASTLLVMGGLGDSKYATYDFLPAKVAHEALSDIYVARIDWDARHALWAPLTVRSPVGFTCYSIVFDRRCGEFMAFSRPHEIFLGRVPEEVLLGRLEDNGISMKEELAELERYSNTMQIREAGSHVSVGSHVTRAPGAVSAADPRRPGDERRDWREVEVCVELLAGLKLPVREEAYYQPVLPSDSLRLMVLTEDEMLVTPGTVVAGAAASRCLSRDGAPAGVQRGRPAPAMLRRQWDLLWWLGRQLDAQYGMPSELWARVVAALFDATWRWCAGGVHAAMKR